MKRFVLVLLLFQSFVLFAEENQETLRKLRWYGGIATFNLTVKDERGEPVPEARGEAWFWYRNDCTRDEAYTDADGKMSLSNSAKTDGGVRITKEGHYTTEIYQPSFSAPSQPFSFWERRRWVPVARDVVLKTKVNPIPMYSKQYQGKIPHLNQPVGFDLKVVDWVHPDGKGEVADVYITVETEVVPFGKIMQKRARTVTWEWPNRYDGVQVCDADCWSALISTYQVNLQQPFMQKLVLTRGQDRYAWLDHGKYLTFRTRSQTSPTGELACCHYGKIYPSFDIAYDEVALRLVFFNPTPNDTNLEFDPKHNLSPFSCYQEETMINRGCP